MSAQSQGKKNSSGVAITIRMRTLMRLSTLKSLAEHFQIQSEVQEVLFICLTRVHLRKVN